MKKEDLLALVAHNKFNQLIQELPAVLEQQKKTDLSGNLAQLTSQYQSFQSQLTAGTLTPSEQTTERNKVSQNFIFFIEKIYARTPKQIRQSRILLISLVTLGCIAFILIAYLPWPTIDFVFTGQTKYLKFKSKKDWDLNQTVLLDNFSSYTVKSIKADKIAFQAPDEEIEEVELYGGTINWQKMIIPADSIVALEIEEDQITCQVFIDSLRATFLLNGTTVNLLNEGVEEKVGTDTLPTLANMTLVQAPELIFTPIEDSSFTVEGHPVSGLDFQRAELNEDRNLESEILDGVVTTRGIPHPLTHSRFIDLIELQNPTLTLYQKQGLFYFRVAGKAKDITIGDQPTNQKSIKSTIIQHLTKSEQANIIWNWIIGALGLASTLLGLRPKKK